MTKRFFSFGGRLSRSDYFKFAFSIGFLFIFSQIFILPMIGVSLLDGPLNVLSFSSMSLWNPINDKAIVLLGVEAVIIFVVLLLYCTTTIQRLRDAGFSSFWFLLVMLPLGELIVLIMTLKESKEQPHYLDGY
ncbi:DUF805 domain-containing protein [Vibrio owensii]|uniref:DUF805 domain-containing protein n=1 Tax=Vibrio harveyi group TaxID=717610 RepID=UPI003CC67A03